MASKCAACGKEGEALKTCGRCSAVNYCSRACQVSHWKQQHKKVCGKPKLRFKLGDRVKCNVYEGDWDPWEGKWASGTIVDVWVESGKFPYGILCDNFSGRTAPEDDDRTIQLLSPPPPKDRNAEMHDMALFEAPPVDDECPVCCLRFPISNDTACMHCCGALICAACIRMTRGSCCPFCRVDQRTLSNADIVQRMEKRVETGNAVAFHMLAGSYDKGDCGLPQDSKKAHELWTRAAELGSRDAHYNLHTSYSEFYEERGVEKDMTKAKYHLEKAAILGDPSARCQLGRYESQLGNFDRAKRHWMISAAAGCDNCMEERIKVGFQKGYVTEEEYAKTLASYRISVDDINSQQRDAIRADRMRRDPSYGQIGPGSSNSASERASYAI